MDAPDIHRFPSVPVVGRKSVNIRAILWCGGKFANVACAVLFLKEMYWLFIFS